MKKTDKQEAKKTGSFPYGIIGMGGFFLTMLGLGLAGIEVPKLELMLMLSAWLLGEGLAWGIYRIFLLLWEKEKDLRPAQKEEMEPEEIGIQDWLYSA